MVESCFRRKGFPGIHTDEESNWVNGRLALARSGLGLGLVLRRTRNETAKSASAASVYTLNRQIMTVA